MHYIVTAGHIIIKILWLFKILQLEVIAKIKG